MQAVEPPEAGLDGQDLGAGEAGLARIARGKVAIINPEPTELDSAADAVLRGKAAQLLPQLLED